MRSADMSDAILVEESSEVRDLLASYVAGCQVLEEVEASATREREVEEVEHRLAAARRQLRSALNRLVASPAHTPSGVLAKGRTMQAYLAEFPADAAEVVGLFGSLFTDLQRLYGDVG